MTPTAIIALIKDIVILGAIGFAIYIVLNYGKDIVKVKDMQAVQKQLSDNKLTEAQWRQEQVDANVQRDQSVKQLADAIATQHTPVYVVRNGSISACPVPGAPPKSSDQTASTGGANSGVGGASQTVDIRAGINAFETKYESSLSDCRAILMGWPK